MEIVVLILSRIESARVRFAKVEFGTNVAGHPRGHRLPKDAPSMVPTNISSKQNWIHKGRLQANWIHKGRLPAVNLEFQSNSCPNSLS
eukprot:scaffold6466_cov38-Attheya_sp.AAC.1